MAITIFCFGIRADSADEITRQKLEEFKAIIGPIVSSTETQQSPVVTNAVPVDSWDSVVPTGEKPASQKQLEWVRNIIRNNHLSEDDVCSQFKCKSIEGLSGKACDSLIKQYSSKNKH